MNAKSIFIAIVLTGAVVLAGIAWEMCQARSAAEKSIAGLSEKIAREQSAVHDLDEKLARAEQERAGLHDALATLRNGNAERHAALGRASGSPSSQKTKAPSVLELLNSDPELQVRQLAAERARLTARYGSFYHSLNLSAQQIEQFDKNAIRHKEQQMDLAAVRQSRNIADADPAMGKLYQQEEIAYATAQSELLGDDGYRQLKEYERPSAVREMVRGLAGAMTLAGEPLTAGQAERLTQVFANASAGYAEGKWANPDTVDWSVVDANARAFLSERQAVLVRTVEPVGASVGSRFQTRLNRLIAEARKADAAGASPGSTAAPAR